MLTRYYSVVDWQQSWLQQFIAMDGERENIKESALAEVLTEREKAILRLIADGASNQEIADDLSLALETVKWYNKRIYSKLGARNRTEAIARVGLLKLFNTPAPSVLPKNNLPVQVTSFVGRKQEIADVTQLLQVSRLLTLTGPAGSGKTRLALEVALISAQHFKDGIFFVPLAPVIEADNVLWTIAEQLDIHFHQRGAPLEQLLRYLSDKQMLLVLDNCEHVLDGIGLVGEIIRAAPHVTVLATSRERLSVYGEVNYTISGLTLQAAPENGQLASDSVNLFFQRAWSVDPNLKVAQEDFQSMIRICQLVEGMPLGIELAATWVDVLSPNEIASEIERSLDILTAELRDVSHRHTSIRAAIDRSWDLLNPAQQVAFRRVSVFRGGFTRDAVGKITGVDLRTLQALVSKSLLRYTPDTGRYEIHELLRQYAHEQLERSGEASVVNEAYATYFADFMDERWPQMKGPRQRTALLEIEADLENVRAAWQYWNLAKNVQRLRQFLHSFWVIYDIRGWYPAGIELFQRGINVMQSIESEDAQAVLGWLLAAQGSYSAAGGITSTHSGPPIDWVAAYGFYSSIMALPAVQQGFVLALKGVELLRSLGEKYEEMLIIPLISMVDTACQLDQEEFMLQAAQDCLKVASRIGDRWAIAKAKHFLALRAIEVGEYQSAHQLAHEALSIFEESGDNWSKSVMCIDVLGLLAVVLRDFEAARNWMQIGLKAAEEIGFQYSIQTAYWQLGFVAALEENYVEAGRYWHMARQIAKDVLVGQRMIGYGGTKHHPEWGGRKLITGQDMGSSGSVGDTST